MSPTLASTSQPIASGSSAPAPAPGSSSGSAPGSSTGGGFLKRLFGGNGAATRTARSGSASAKGKEPETVPAGPPTGAVFGVALDVSLRYASVAISQVDEDGKARVYGHIPVVVAKTGLYLKENGTTTPGIFRVSGSNKRIKELEHIFNTPPLYGKDMVWQTYSVHDAASAFRRYLNMLPNPVVPFALYTAFHDALPPSSPPSPIEVQEAIGQYRNLIKSLPASSQHLLFYTLDLLSIFHAKSEQNLMPASNLALIFQVGLLRADTGVLNLVTSNATPDSGTGPLAAAASAEAAQAMLGADEGERKKSQDVLEFLIKHAASFELELPPHVRVTKPPKRPSGTPSRSSSGTRLASLAAAITPSRGGSASPVSVPPSPKLASPAAESTPIGAPADATQVQAIGRSASQKKKLRRQSADVRPKPAPVASSTPATDLKRAHTVSTRSPSRLTADGAFGLQTLADSAATVKNQLTAPSDGSAGSRPSTAERGGSPRKGWTGAFKLGAGNRRKSMDAPREQ